jgi:hypothetical protein
MQSRVNQGGEGVVVIILVDAIDSSSNYSSILRLGLFNPHTMDGDLVVDGIHTSIYTAAIAPSLAHSILWPIRMLFSLGLDVLNGSFDQGSEFIASIMPRGRRGY